MSSLIDAPYLITLNVNGMKDVLQLILFSLLKELSLPFNVSPQRSLPFCMAALELRDAPETARGTSTV